MNAEDLDQQLSAYLDGMLDHAELKKVDGRIAGDPEIAARLEGLRRANSLARDYFETVLNEPVPLSLARDIESGTARPRAPSVKADAPAVAAPFFTMPGLRAVAASLVLLATGLAAGWMVATWNGPEESLPDWLVDIADYHRIYAAEKRHLVEVPASEQAHLESWLTKVVGAELRVPDLAPAGLQFEGGRLLAAGGQPVAQLMFRHPDGRVVALCMISSSDGPSEGFDDVTIGPTRLVSWRDETSAWVVVGEADDPSLPDIARKASGLI